MKGAIGDFLGQAPEVHVRANALSLVQQMEGFIDPFQGHGVGDQLIELDFTIDVLVDHAREFGTSTHTTKSGSALDTSGHQLEGPGADFLTGTGHPDDNAFAPTLVTAFQRCPHQFDITDTLKRIVDTTIGKIDDHLLNGGVVISAVNTIYVVRSISLKS